MHVQYTQITRGNFVFHEKWRRKGETKFDCVEGCFPEIYCPTFDGYEVIARFRIFAVSQQDVWWIQLVVKRIFTLYLYFERAIGFIGRLLDMYALDLSRLAFL